MSEEDTLFCEFLNGCEKWSNSGEVATILKLKIIGDVDE